MIKINLLPQQKRVRSTNVQKDIVIFASALALVFGSVFLTDYYFNAQLEVLQAQKAEKDKIRANLQQQVGKVSEMLAEIDKVEGRVKIIKNVRLRQGLPVKYIDEVVTNIPVRKIWFEKFTINANGNIALSGVAMDNQSFASYVEKLRTSHYIAGVDTQRTSRIDVGGLSLVSFQCSVTAKEYFENTDTNGTTNG